MIGQNLGPYEVVAKIGEGGMGAVYRGRDRRLHRDVAIKVILPEVANDPDHGRLCRLAQRIVVGGTAGGAVSAAD